MQRRAKLRFIDVDKLPQASTRCTARIDACGGNALDVINHPFAYAGRAAA